MKSLKCCVELFVYSGVQQCVLELTDADASLFKRIHHPAWHVTIREVPGHEGLHKVREALLRDGSPDLARQALRVGNIVVRSQDGCVWDALGHQVVQKRPRVLLAGHAGAVFIQRPAWHTTSTHWN